MKISSSIWVVGFLGLLGVVLCFACSNDGWTTFNKVENCVGYVADMAIAVAILNFFAPETIDIKGIGKVRIKRRQNNIQDLTNIISWKKFGGDQFQRNKLLSAFYKDSPVSIEDDTEEIISLVSSFPDASPSFLLRTNVNSIKSLMDAVKWIWNDGKELSNDIKSDIYTQWYKINQHSPAKDSTFKIVYGNSEFSIDRRDFRTIDELIGVAQCVLNEGEFFDNETLVGIYRKWYRVE
ncbi:MAG: hypothetical protein K2G77_01720 [Muribaculaceae bacterium]|nr:hypothetical protein [Muribaculaceae bacterium]